MQYIDAEQAAKILQSATIKEAITGTQYNGDYEEKATNDTLTLTLSNGKKLSLILADLIEEA